MNDKQKYHAKDTQKLMGEILLLNMKCLASHLVSPKIPGDLNGTE